MYEVVCVLRRRLCRTGANWTIIKISLMNFILLQRIIYEIISQHRMHNAPGTVQERQGRGVSNVHVSAALVLGQCRKLGEWTSTLVYCIAQAEF